MDVSEIKVLNENELLNELLVREFRDRFDTDTKIIEFMKTHKFKDSVEIKTFKVGDKVKFTNKAKELMKDDDVSIFLDNICTVIYIKESPICHSRDTMDVIPDIEDCDKIHFFSKGHFEFA